MNSSPPSFLSHLVAVLSIYELAPSGLPSSTPPKTPPIPCWDGERTWETDAILRSLSVIGDRLGFPPQQQPVEERTEDKTDPTDLQNPIELPLPPLHIPSHSSHVSSHFGYPPSSGAVLGDDPVSAPLVVLPPGGPLVPENEISTLDELRLLKASLSDVATVCNAVARGDLTQKITSNVHGIVMIQIKDVINAMVDRLSQFSQEVIRVSVEIGTGGCLSSRALVPGAEPEDTWSELTGVVNKLAATSTDLVRSVAEVAKAVALGDLSKQIEVDLSGEMLDMKFTVNYMVDSLRTLVAEVTSMTLETGSQGRLGSQVHVPGVDSGVWFELVKNVNRVCSSLNDQVRANAATGDLTQKVEIEHKPE